MSVSRFSGSGVVVANYDPIPDWFWSRTLSLAPDGTMLFGGSIWSFAYDTGVPGIGRRRPDGSADPTFPTRDFGAGVTLDSAVLRDGRYVLGGTNEGQSAGRILRVWN